MDQAPAMTGMAWVKGLRVTPAAPMNSVAWDMFEDLARHVAEGFCVGGCDDCHRWLAVRSLLMKPFDEDGIPKGPALVTLRHS